MKRSAVIQKIEKYLIDNFTNSSSHKYAAEYIMEIIEDAGMLPPPIYKGPDGHGGSPYECEWNEE